MILITGATGFVGSQLAADLAEKGHRLRCLKRTEGRIPHKLLPYSHTIDWVDGDITDWYALEEAFEGVREVYHCAATVSFNPAMTEQIYRVNITGTTNVVDLALTKGIRKLVHVSSIAALGAVKGGLIDEQSFFDEDGSHSAYAISKYKSELEVWRGMAEGLDAVIVNPSVIIGPCENWHTGFGPLIKRAAKGIRFYTEGMNSLVDVRDVSRAMQALMQAEKTNGRYILSGSNISFRDWFTLMNKAFQHPAPSIKIPAWLIELIWRFSAVFSWIFRLRNRFPKSLMRTSIEQNCYTSDKIKQELDYSFTPVEISIEQTCKAYVTYLHATNR